MEATEALLLAEPESVMADQDLEDAAGDDESVEPTEPELTEEPHDPAALAPQNDAETEGQSSSENVAQTGAGNELSDDELLQSLTALIYASPEPLSERRLAALLDHPAIERVRQALDALQAKLAATGLPLELRSIAGGWQILTAPRMNETVLRLFKSRKHERISPAALETLAVVAYRQPVTKAEIEAIRGVQVGPVLRALVDRGLARIAGRADVPGHPLQYGTTRAFLDRFGLASLEDLPRDSELAKD